MEVLFPYDLRPTFESGDLKHVPNFSMSPPTPVSKSTKKIVIPKDYNFLSSQYILEDNELAGIANVDVRLPQVGTPYRFEKLLVLGESLVVSVNYKSAELVESAQNWKYWGIIGVVVMAFVAYIWKR